MRTLSKLVQQGPLLANLKLYDLSPLRYKQRRPDISHPAFWYEDYPIALVGRRQSPINIQTHTCVRNSKELKLSPELQLEYPKLFHNLKLRNPKDDTFFGWRVDIPYNCGDKTCLTGGPLNHKFKLVQFHAHWGKDCSCGSEHVIDGKHYSSELHFVHWNCDLYDSPRKAAISKDGLAVVGVFLQTVPDDEPIENNESMQKLCDMMDKIKYKGDQVYFNEPYNVLDLLPKKRSYYTYLGSLTTPPLWESVTWIVFEQPIKCTEKQLNSFRQLLYYNKDDLKGIEDLYPTNIEENFRPIQPLNERRIIYVLQ